MVTSLPGTHAATRWRQPRVAAWVSGAAGIVAGALLVMFFALADPYGWRWTGPANDVAVTVQFAAFAPAAWALRRRLPATRAVRAGTVAAVFAMVVVAVLSLLLVAGALPYEAQLPAAIAAFLVVYAWLLVADLAAHRARTLPRRVTRTGLLLAVAFLVGMVLTGAGLVLPAPAGRIALWPGLALAFPGWLGLPAYPLFLARYVFTKEAS
jgi:hypothetical protein